MILKNIIQKLASYYPLILHYLNDYMGKSGTVPVSRKNIVSGENIPESEMASFIHLLNKDGAPVFVNINTAAVQWLLPNNATFGMLKVVTYISEDSDKRYFEDLSTNATSWVIPPDGISPSAYKICEEVLNMSNSLVSSYIRQPFNAAASQRQQDIIDEWIDSLDDTEQQQSSQQSYNQTQMNQQNILPPPPPPPPAVIQSFQSQPPQPPQPPPPIPTTTTSFTQKLFGSNNNSNTNNIPPPPPPPPQIQFAGNNKYVQMLNAETISVFVDINTGSPTWTLPNDASIKNLKVVTYLLDDSGKVYFETIETMQTSWTLPTAGLSSQCISTCNEIRVANNSRCAELIRAPYNESISAQHQQKFDQWIDSLDEEAENLQSSKPVQPPQQPPQPPQQPPQPPQPAVQPQQQQRLSTSISGPTAPLAPIKDYKYAHVLNADGMPLFVGVSSGSASWSIPNDVKTLDDLKVVSYITEDTGRRYYELIEEEKTSWTWPTDGLSQNALRMCQELEKMSNLQCANAMAVKFDAALSNRQQDKVNEWLDALDESADKVSALPVISGGSAGKRTSNSGPFDDHDSDEEDIRMSEFVRYQNIQDESLKKESTRRASLIDLRKQLNVVDAHNDDVQDSSHVKSIKSIRAERFKAGYMTKCAKGNERNWKKRYFVLNSYALVYYVNESYLAAGNSAGEFQLLGETRIQEEDENEHGFCFRVIHSVENMIIAAPTNDVKREWIKEISNVINKNQESLREYVTVREKFMGITQRSKHFAILRKDVMTLHPNHEKICIIERVLNINQYTKITASDDINCRISLLDVSGKGISGHSKDFEVTFQFEDNQRAYIQWKGYLEQCIANYVQVAKSGSSAPVPRGSAGNMSAQSSELSPAIPKPAGSLPRPPMPKPTLMGGGTSTFSNKSTSNPSYRIDEATGLRTLVPLNEEKGRPVVRIIFDRYCSENELISIEGIHQIYYDFDKFYPIEEVADAVNKSLGGNINSISYEDFMVFWRSVPKFDQLKTSKADVQRRYEAAYRFRSYDVNAQGYISRNDYALFYKLLQTDGILSSDSDAVSAEDSLKAVLDITAFNVVKFNNWITWFDAQKPPSKGQTILTTSTSTFGKLFGKLSGRTTSPGPDKVSASGSDSRSSSPSRTQDTKPNNNVGVFGVNADNVFDDDDEEEIIVVQHQPSTKPNTHVPFETPVTTPSNAGNRTTTAVSSTPQQSSMVDNSFSAMQRRPVTAFSQSALTSNSISDFVQDLKYAREEDEKLFSDMTNKLNINQVVSGEDAPSRRRNTVRFKDASASSTVAAPTKSYSTCGVQTDEVLPINDIYRNPYEELLNERLAIQEAFEKLKNEESEILEFIRQKEDESLRKLQEMSDRLADEKRDFEVYKMTTTIDFEEKRSVLEGEKLKLQELKIKADKLHRARSTELLMSAAALSKHHKLLLQERRKTARQRFHLNFSLQQMHALQGDGNISPNPNSLNTNNRVNMRSESPVRQLPYQQGVNSPMAVQQRHQVATQQHLNRLQEYNNVSRAHTPKRQMNYTS